MCLFSVRAFRPFAVFAPSLCAAFVAFLAAHVQPAAAAPPNPMLCRQILADLHRDYELLRAATADLERVTDLLTAATGRGDHVMMHTYTAELRQKRAVFNRGQGEVNRHTLEWHRARCDEDDDDPPQCEEPSPLFAGALGRVPQNSGSSNRTALDRARGAAAALAPFDPDARSLPVRVRPDGVLLNPANGAPVASPAGGPQIRVPVGSGGIDPGDIFALRTLPVQPPNSSPVTLFQLIGPDGQAVVAQPPPRGTPAGAWAAWASTYFHIDVDATTAVPLAAAAASMSPLVRQILFRVGAAAVEFGGLLILRLTSELAPPPGCAYHFQVAYRSEDTASPSQSNPLAAQLGITSAVRALAEPQLPDTDPTVGPPDTGNGGSGSGIVAIYGSTCGRINGVWDIRIFVGDKETGKGFSLKYQQRLGTGWTNPVPSSIDAFHHLFDDNESHIDITNPDDYERVQIWDRMKSQFKTGVATAIANSRGHLLNRGGFNRRRSTRIELQGPYASGITRKTVQRGCNISTPRGYQERDTPF